MSQELTLPNNERPVVMRSGLVHWVSTATAENIQRVLAGQSGHSFLKITEKGITVNTADVEGVYDLAQYEDLVKVKQGMYQCEYQKWHGKREACDCKREAQRQHSEALRKAREVAENRELTEEERANNLRRILEMRAHFNKTGLFSIGPRVAGGGQCLICPNRCPAGHKWYCRGECMTKAKERGIYGREEAHLVTKQNSI